MDINTIIICSTILLGFIISIIFINNKIKIATSPKHIIEKISALFTNNKETQSFLQDMSAGIFKSFKSTEEKISGIKYETNNNDLIYSIIIQFLMTPSASLREFLSDGIVSKIDFIKNVLKRESAMLCDPMLTAIDDIIMMVTNSDHHLSSDELANIIAKETNKNEELRTFIMQIKIASATVSTPAFKELFESECTANKANTLESRLNTMKEVLESLAD